VLTACAPEAPLDHYWSSSRCEVSNSTPAVASSCEVYLSGSIDRALVVRLAAPLPASVPRPVVAGRGESIADRAASLTLTGTDVLLQALLRTATRAYRLSRRSSARPAIRVVGRLWPSQLATRTQRAAHDDRDSITLEFELDLSGASCAAVALDGLVRIHAADDWSSTVEYGCGVDDGASTAGRGRRGADGASSEGGGPARVVATHYATSPRSRCRG